MSKISNHSQQENNSGGFQTWHLINLCFGLIWPGMFVVLVQTFVLDVTGSAADAGLVMATLALGALATPVFGSMADRYKAHRIVQSLAFLMVIIGLVLMGLAKDKMFFMLAALLIGFGAAPGIMINNVYAVASGLSRKAEAKTVASLKRMLFIGQIVGGLLIAGLLLTNLSYTSLFLINASIATVCLLLTIFTTKDIAAHVAELATSRVTKAHEEAPPGKFSLNDIFKSTLGLSLLVIFLNQLGWIGIMGQYTNFFAQAFGIQPSISAVVNSLGVLLGLAVIGFAGNWLGKSGPVPLMSTNMIIRILLAISLTSIGWVLGGTIGTIILPMLIWIGFRLVMPLVAVSNPVLIARTSIGGAAQAQALMTAFFALGNSMGNLLSGQLAENIGWMALPWQTVIFCTLSFLVMRFGVAPRLDEGINEPESEMLLTLTIENEK